MASSALGKRTRGSKEVEGAEQLPSTKRCRRQTRSFRDTNSENEDPSEAPSDAVAVIEEANGTKHDTRHGTRHGSQEEGTSYRATLATTTPSRSRTKTVDVEPVKYKVPVTPSTPRHRHVLSKAPSTPRHQVMSAGKLSRRPTPRTPLSPASSQTIYHEARQLFSRSADPGQLIGRDHERMKLREFLGRCDKPRPNGCLYVSGPPGTGKSAMVNEITNEVLSKVTSVRKAYINCMSIKSSNDLYLTLVEFLSDDAETEEEKDAVSMLHKMFVPKQEPERVFLVVLDEVDHILSLDLDSMYKLIEWSMQKTSRLVLVGIANALDLTDRFLPHLKSRNLKPELLPFLPYTAAQVKTIMTMRLKSLLPRGAANPDYVPFFHPAAIELCSRKVSSQTGDLRRAYEICRRALDLVETETRQKLEEEAKEQILQATPSRKVLGEKTNLSSPSKASSSHSRSADSILEASLKSLTVENAPRVSIAHLNKVTAAALSNGTSQRLKTLNLQQKAALCALTALERRSRVAVRAVEPITPTKSSSRTSAAPTIRTLFDTYGVLCKRDAILHPLTSSEFREVVGSLETLSLITPVDGKTGSFAALTPSRKVRRGLFGIGTGSSDERRVASCVGDKELEKTLEGHGASILKSILNGEALD